MRPDPSGTRLAVAIVNSGGKDEVELLDAVRIPTRVKRQVEEFEGFDSTRHSVGWFVYMEGSREGLFVGAAEHPLLKAGSVVMVVLQVPKP